MVFRCSSRQRRELEVGEETEVLQDEILYLNTLASHKTRQEFPFWVGLDRVIKGSLEHRYK